MWGLLGLGIKGAFKYGGRTAGYYAGGRVLDEALGTDGLFTSIGMYAGATRTLGNTFRGGAIEKFTRSFGGLRGVASIPLRGLRGVYRGTVGLPSLAKAGTNIFRKDVIGKTGVAMAGLKHPFWSATVAGGVIGLGYGTARTLSGLNDPNRYLFPGGIESRQGDFTSNMSRDPLNAEGLTLALHRSNKRIL